MDYIDVLSSYSSSADKYGTLRNNIRDLMIDSVLQTTMVEVLENKVKTLELRMETARLQYQISYLELRNTKLDAGTWDQDLEDWFQKNEMTWDADSDNNE